VQTTAMLVKTAFAFAAPFLSSIHIKAAINWMSLPICSPTKARIAQPPSENPKRRRQDWV
jgi:hypothetical protein